MIGSNMPLRMCVILYPTREEAIEAYILMRSVRFGCVYIPRGERGTILVDCGGFRVYEPNR